jgi:galactose mutarotase-like enzyme
MIDTISNSQLQASVTKTGIELSSVKSLASDLEYIWQAAPDVWGSHAPVLFPIIGGLKNGEYRFDGDFYELPKHGFVRYNNDIELIRQTDESLLFSLSWNADSMKKYPFKFELLTHYSLEGSTISVEHTVINHDNQKMYFSLGGHPAFNCPLFEGESYSDYYLEFDQREKAPAYLLDESGLVSDKTLNLLDKSRTLQLNKHLFDDDALIFRDLKSRHVKLVSSRTGDILSMAYEGFPYLGVWAKPGAPFVCIEPWQGIADSADSTQDLTEKEGILSLGAGERHQASYSITFHK